MSEERYQKMVARGKEIVEKIRELDKQLHVYQMDIAKMAVAVCNIRHGGISKNIYTIKDYAEDIGLTYKTVQNWTSIYRNVVVKLDSKVRTPEDWKKARETNDIMKEERRNINKGEGRPGSRHAWKQDVPKEKVRDVFKSLKTKEGTFMKDFIRINSSSKHVLYKLETNDLGMINDRELLGLMETLDKASDVINDYLTSKNKKVKRTG